MKYLISFVSLLLLVTSLQLDAQNNRIHTGENIGWYNYFGTIQWNDRWGVHTEYQWRRDDWGERWQQSLLRFGINFQARPNVLLRAGYGWIETFAYGEIPINGLGRDFTEHRAFEMIQLQQKEGRVQLNHRFMLEQRWIGRYTTAAAEQEDEFLFANRIRYMMRGQIPLTKNTEAPHAPYLAVYDELFIGFGKNVNANVFDQNRIGILVGAKICPWFRLEGGYLQQMIQFGRQMDGRSVFQNNQGIIVNALFQWRVKKKTE